MSRVALIGENSVEYIEKLLDIWNDNDCAVLIDCQIPVLTAIDMMNEAQVDTCYIEKKYYEKMLTVRNVTIKLISYEKESNSAQLLPSEIYEKFKENYSRDEAIVIYSSGTTGKAKGIILSHFAINTNADAIIDYMQPTDNDCMYIVKNLTHSSTITGELLVSLKTRNSLLIAPVIVPPRYVLGNISKYKVSILCVNPILLSMYAQEYRSRNYDISSLKTLYVSGSILNDKEYEAAHEAFNELDIYNVYGLSEAGPRVTAQRHNCCNSNSVGMPINGVDVIIVDEQGVPVTKVKRGIIHVNSPSIFDRYISGEKKHQSLYRDWLNTGDIGYFDEQNELHIVGRIDEMIIIGSHKIYPAEVEKHIRAFADIRECVVTSASVRGEDILCCLYSADVEIQSDMINRLGTVLMKYEIPKVYVRVDMIPRTQNGKLALQRVKIILTKELERR